MRVIMPASSPSRHRLERSTRAATIELLGLTLSTIVVLAGVLLTYVGQTQAVQTQAVQTQPVETIQSDPATGPLVNLSRLRGAEDLAPLLTMFESPFERNAVARALYRRATSATSPLDHVGELAGVTIPASEVRADPRFVELGGRLTRRPDLDRVPVLSPADLATVKQGTIVRTPEELAARLRLAIGLFFAAFWGAHLVRRWRGIDDDPVLLPIVLLLSGIGLMSMVALRDPLRDTVLAYPFALGVAGGAAALVACAFADFEASRLRRAVALPLFLPWVWRRCCCCSGADRVRAARRSICLACSRWRRSGSSSSLPWRRISPTGWNSCASSPSRPRRRGRGSAPCRFPAGRTSFR